MIDSRTKVLIVDDDITSQRIMEKINPHISGNAIFFLPKMAKKL